MRPHSIHLATCTLVALSSAAPTVAQGVVTPVHFTTTEGQANRFPNNWPAFCSNATPDRQQQIHDDLIGLGPRIIRGIAFRLDGTLTNANHGGFSAVITVRMSHAASNASGMQSSFSANHGAGMITVASIPVTFPVAAWQGLHGPFVYRIDFGDPSLPNAQTFAYDGIHPICWDIEVSSHTNVSTIRCDLASGTATNPGLTALVFGSGCAAPGGTTLPTLRATQTVSWTATPPHIDISYGGAGLGSASFGILALGTPQLIPPLQLPIGHPGCLAHFVPIQLQTVALANGGTGTPIPVRINTTAAFNGLDVFAQMAAFEGGAWIVTNPVQHNVCAPFGPLPVSTVRQLAFAAPTLQVGEGSIVELF